MLREAYAETYPVRPLLNQIDKLKKALHFIWDLSGECMDNGDVRVGTGAEVAMRHIHRKAEENL